MRSWGLHALQSCILRGPCWQIIMQVICSLAFVSSAAAGGISVTQVPYSLYEIFSRVFHRIEFRVAEGPSGYGVVACLLPTPRFTSFSENSPSALQGARLFLVYPHQSAFPGKIKPTPTMLALETPTSGCPVLHSLRWVSTPP